MRYSKTLSPTFSRSSLPLLVQNYTQISTGQKDIPIDRIVKILNFVRDFIDLSPEFENEFQQTQYSLVFPNSDDMTISQGSKDFAAGLYEHVFGINPLTEVEKERQKAAKERQRAEEEHQRAEEEHQRAEEERQRINGIILYFHQEMHLPAIQIAEVVDKDLAYIEDLIAKAAAGNDEN